ncbi:MAG: hypothetical protein J2P25_23185 [Nocardiopsaceae bacterium]|nr:hypothetical protein [Nocardiopsaceae bacterium]
MPYSEIRPFGGQYKLEFWLSSVPSKRAIYDAGHENSGVFWESVASFLAPGVVRHVELASVHPTFNAYGDRAQLQKLQATLEPLLGDGNAIVNVIRRAEANGTPLTYFRYT